MNDQNFFKTASKLSRNPLGIIALFIVLVYGLAALVLVFSVSYLGLFERVVLILFVVIFPFVVLRTFYILVKEHHTKLYSPMDFGTKPELFWSHATNEEIKTKHIAEVLEVAEPETESIGKQTQTDSNHHKTDSNNSNGITKKEKIDFVFPKGFDFNKFSAKISKAEEYALKVLAIDSGGMIFKDVKLPNGLVVDGLMKNQYNHGLVLIEVKYLQYRSNTLNTITQRIIPEMIARIKDLQISLDTLGLLYVVIDGTTENMINHLQTKLNSIEGSMDVKVIVSSFKYLETRCSLKGRLD